MFVLGGALGLALVQLGWLLLLLLIGGRDLTESIPCEILMHLIKVITHDEHLRAEVVYQVIVGVVLDDRLLETFFIAKWVLE